MKLNSKIPLMSNLSEGLYIIPLYVSANDKNRKILCITERKIGQIK